MDGWKNSTQHSLQICPYSFIFNHFSICCLSNVLVLFREYFLPELQYNVGSSIQTRQKHVELSSAYYYQRYAADAGGPFQRMLQLVFHGRSTWNSPAHTTTSVPRQLDAAQQFNQLIILVVYSTNRILNSISTQQRRTFLISRWRKAYGVKEYIPSSNSIFFMYTFTPQIQEKYLLNSLFLEFIVRLCQVFKAIDY